MVPKGWEVTTLGEHVTISSGYSPSKYVLAESGSFPFVKVEDMNNCAKYQSISRTYTETNGSPISKGAVIFPKRGAAIMNNKVRITDVEMYLDTNMMALTPKKSVFSEYLYYTLIKEELHKIADTSTIPQINNKHILPYRFKLPPLPEQKKIAKILSTWDNAIATTEKLIATSQQQKKALMQQLLTGKKRLVNPETGKAFEGEWEEVPLSNWLVEFKEKSSVQDQHRVYTSSRSGLVPQDEYFGNSRISDRKNIGFHILPPGHMTYRSRSDDGYFTFNLFKGNENGIISHYYPVFTSKGSNDFFIALLEQYRNVFGKHSVGTSQKVLSFNALKAIRFFVPSTYEQQKIASVLIAADKEIELLQAKLAHLKDEKKALMQQLLTGKRRVKVDENVAA